MLILVSAIVVGMSWMVMTDSRLGGNNKDRENAFYGAEAGMEKMTTDVGNEFATQGSLTGANVATIVGNTPTLPGIQYQNTLGSTYQILCGNPLASPCIPASQNATILPPSPYAGMQGLITPFTLSVAAQTTDGAEVKLQRQIQAVAIPVFQFGVFSQSDLSFFAGPPFNFGGRVHTNGNLWLAANLGPLWLSDKVTVVGQVIRTNLENGYPAGSTLFAAGGAYTGTINIGLVPNSVEAVPADWRALALTEGSTTGSSVYGAVNLLPLNVPDWTGTVEPAYQGQLTNGVTALNLTSTALGGITQPISLIRRPIVGEAGSNPAEFSEQYYDQASLRILLDDYPGTVAGSAGACNAADMMSLDTIDTSKNPVDLATLAWDTSAPGANGNTTIPFSAPPAWIAANVGALGVYPLPVSDSQGGITTYQAGDGYWVKQYYPTITGCIKIEYENAGGTAWVDVTQEILKLGYTGRNIDPLTGKANIPAWVAPPALEGVPSAQIAADTAVGCNNLSGSAVIRLARVRDNPSTAAGANGWCGLPSATAANQHGYDYWPNMLYDTREGIQRPEFTPANLTAEGAMYYIELDVANLDQWFLGTIGTSGKNADFTGGYAVYFSDRRGNAIDPVAGIKVGAFGFNDIVNPASANACPSGALDGGEDLEGDGILRTYGEAQLVPQFLLPATPKLTPNALCAISGPQASFNVSQESRENPPIFFRRALKVVNGSTVNLGTNCFGAAPNPPCGLTITSENPVYIQGDFNAPGGNLAAAGTVATSVAADAVSLLSDSWNDINTFVSPYNDGLRNAVQTSYRVALISGKPIPFADPPGEATQDFGTDGGLHNFLRFLENWGGINCNYEGSLVSFYFNRQANGLYKNTGSVYSPPTRVYNFDQNFTNGPQWLPPRTPSLRSVNTVGFTQEILPTQ
jgi:hypothetical protein